MDENRPFYFRSQVRYDLAAYQECTKASIESETRFIIFQCIQILCLAYLIGNFSNPYIIWIFFGLTLFTVVNRLLQRRNSRKSDIAYQRIVHQNDGLVPRNALTLEDDGIHTLNLDTGRQRIEGYDRVRSLLETKNYLLIILELNMYLALDKNAIQGGSLTELIYFLRQHCPKLKKKLRSARPGRIASRIVTCLLVVGCLIGVALLLELPARLTGQITNDRSCQEIAAELEPLGIAISEEAIAEIERYGGSDKVLDLLCVEGMGTYDPDTFEWTLSRSGVYWFDMEVMSIDSIYTDFFAGLSAMDEALNFTNVQEDYSAIDLESGVGTIPVSFDWNGQHHTLEAAYYYDWFDMDILAEVIRIVNADSGRESLYYAYDGGQGTLLYYGTAADVRVLGRMTGLSFTQRSPASLDMIF